MFDNYINQITNKTLAESSLNQIKSNIDNIEPNAFYMAIVINTDDDMKCGRVQIRVPAIHGVKSNQKYYVVDSDLPWARPALFAGAANDTGQFIVPPMGSRVFITFEYNDLSRPIYFGGIPFVKGTTEKLINDNSNIFYGQNLSITDNDRIKDLDDNNSAQTVVFKSLKGATIIIDDKDGNESLKIIDAAGQQIIMENKSEDTLPRRGTRTNPPETASISIISNGTVNIKCKHFNLEETDK